MDPNQQARGVSFKETSFILVLMMTVGIMLLPLPTTMMDLLLAFSISISLILLILSVNVENPLQLSSFPSILLIGALLRLALNIASTRLILSKGDQGPDAVSRVIAAFADLVVGGNVVLGVIIFAILVTINFVVITKGSGRIAEVAARFTLDAMPGKQMSIDADLAAGLIKEEEAKERRKNLQLEANFFGAMDGASKFVRGDAIAGLIIVAVNIIGGLVIGTAQKDLSLGDAAEIYTMLTIGDGLVSQVPALLTSVAAGIITTRITSETSLGTEVSGQLFASKRAMFIAAGTLGTLGAVPGMPTMPFLALASILAFGASRVKEEEPEVPVSTEPELSTSEKDRQELEENLSMDLLEMEVGYELVPLVDMSNDGMLLKRISGIRKQIANDLGVIVQPIHMRDNLMLKPAEYRVMLSGQEIARGEIRPRRLLAMNPAGGAPNIEGEVTVEPAFGLDARWIFEDQKEKAEMMGYTVVDAPTVAATHLGEVLTSHAASLLGRRELQELLEIHGRDNAKVIEELIPDLLNHGQLIKVLRNLLAERLSIRDFRTILEALADFAGDYKDADQLSELVRQRMSRQITAMVVNEEGAVPAIVLAPEVENVFRRLQNPAAAGVLNPAELDQLMQFFQDAATNAAPDFGLPVFAVAADIRRTVMTFVNRHLPHMAVISFRELSSQAEIMTVGIVGASNDPELLKGAA